MTSNSDRKKAARAYAAEHNINYTAALRILDQIVEPTPGDPYMLVHWLPQLAAQDAVVRDGWERANNDEYGFKNFPWTRNMNVALSWYESNYVGEHVAGVIRDEYQTWLRARGTFLPHLIAYPGHLGRALTAAINDPEFPDTADYDTVAAYFATKSRFPNAVESFEEAWAYWVELTTPLSGMPGRYVCDFDDASDASFIPVFTLPAGEPGWVRYTADEDLLAGTWTSHKQFPKLPPRSVVFRASLVEDDSGWGEQEIYFLEHGVTERPS